MTSACEFKGAGFPLLITGHGLLGWSVLEYLRACFHEGGGPQVGEVTCGGLPHLTCKRDHIKMRDCMDRRVTPPKRVTSPTWGPPPPCKQALKVFHFICYGRPESDPQQTKQIMIFALFYFKEAHSAHKLTD